MADFVCGSVMAVVAGTAVKIVDVASFVRHFRLRTPGTIRVGYTNAVTDTTGGLPFFPHELVDFSLPANTEVWVAPEGDNVLINFQTSER